MADLMAVNVYGYFPTPEQQKQDKIKTMERIYLYLEAEIKSQILNPENDYEEELKERLLKIVVASVLHLTQRQKLVNIIFAERE